MMNSSNKQKSIQSFEDLANQDVIDYGTVEFGSTMMFFKVLQVLPNPVFRPVRVRPNPNPNPSQG